MHKKTIIKSLENVLIQPTYRNISKWQQFVKWLLEQMFDFIVDSKYDTISSHTTFHSQNETQHLQTM